MAKPTVWRMVTQNLQYSLAFKGTDLQIARVRKKELQLFSSFFSTVSSVKYHLVQAMHPHFLLCGMGVGLEWYARFHFTVLATGAAVTLWERLGNVLFIS